MEPTDREGSGRPWASAEWPEDPKEPKEVVTFRSGVQDDG